MGLELNEFHRFTREKSIKADDRPIELGREARDDDALERGDLTDVGGRVFDVLVVDDQHPSARRLEDVGDARAARGVMNGDLDRPDAEDAEPREQEVRARRHHHGDAVSTLDSKLTESRGNPSGTLDKLAIGDRSAVDERKRLRPARPRLLLGKRREIHGRALPRRAANLAMTTTTPLVDMISVQL